MLSRTTLRKVVRGLAWLGVFSIAVHLLWILWVIGFITLSQGDTIENLTGVPEPLYELQGWGGHPPQWFPDGERIAFSHEGAVYVVDSAGSHLQLVDGGDGELDLAYGPSVSPDGSRIAYAAYEESWEIVTARPDGSDWLRLTEDNMSNLNPIWSPDGTRIFFLDSTALYAVAEDSSDSSVRVVDLGGRPIARVFVLAPDGSQMAFVAGGSQGRETFVVNTDGSGLMRLADDTGLPAWSPDSRHIAYAKDEVGGGELVAAGIYTVGIDGSDVREIISFPGREVDWIDNILWSPDGSEMLFGTTVIAADGSAVRELPISSHSSWSPDGSRIAAYNEVPRSGAVLSTLARDGTDARVLVELSEDGSLIAAEGRPLT